MSCRKKCGKCDECNVEQGPRGFRGPTGTTGEIGPTGPCCTGPTGGDSFLQSSFLNVDNVSMPPLTSTVVASFLVGSALSPARFLNVASAFSAVANNTPAFAVFQLQINGAIQPNLARLTIDAMGGDSGSLLARYAAGPGPVLVELIGTNQSNAAATFTVNAGISVSETAT